MKKIIVFVSLILILFFASFSLYKYMYGFQLKLNKNREIYKQYFWLLKESTKIDIHKFIHYSQAEKEFTYSYLVYKNNYRIYIWDFGLINSDIDSQNIIQTDLSDESISTFGQLNENSNPKIKYDLDLALHGRLQIAIDSDSTKMNQLTGPNYEGLYGIINKMVFKNTDGQNMVIFDYPKGGIPSLLLVYKKNNNLYVIMLDSKEPSKNDVKPEMVNLFNLN